MLLNTDLNARKIKIFTATSMSLMDTPYIGGVKSLACIGGGRETRGGDWVREDGKGLGQRRRDMVGHKGSRERIRFPVNMEVKEVYKDHRRWRSVDYTPYCYG